MPLKEKLKQTLRSFMNGRYGGDELSKVLLWSAMAIYLLGVLSNLSPFLALGLILYGLTVWRMFSRSIDKRRAENWRYLSIREKWRTKWRQAIFRWKSRKEYKYFRCPQCKSRLKLPRKVGEVTVTCGSCKHRFQQKA